MDPPALLLLLVAVCAAASVALLTVQIHAQLTHTRALVRARIVPRDRRSTIPPSRVLGGAPRPWWERVSRVGYALLPLVSGLTGLTVGARVLPDVAAGPWLGAAGGALLGGLVPRALQARQRRRRLEHIEAQLPDALLAIARSLRAGAGLLHAITYAAQETPAPLGTELQRVLRDLELGGDAEDVFTDLADRVGSPDLTIAVTAIVIQRTVGGNLSEILANVTMTIRERARLRREVRVLTTRQRLTSNLVAAVPVVIAVAFVAINPAVAGLLFTTVPGQIALAIGVGFELLGIVMVRQLGQIEV